MAAITPDGRHVAFESVSDNLVPGDTNDACDIFVRDRMTGLTSRVNIAPNGQEANSRSDQPLISADGRYVAFRSQASNLVRNDLNGFPDVFVHDRWTGRTELASVDPSGQQGNNFSSLTGLSSDGRHVVCSSYADNLVPGDTNGTWDIFVHDQQTGRTARVSVDSRGNQANDKSWTASISDDGRCVAFWSLASNLVAGDTNGFDDVFVHDRQTGETTIVSISSAGTQGIGQSILPTISSDGRFVAFSSSADNLVPNDTNGALDVFVHDRRTGQTIRASLSSAGIQGTGESMLPSISPNGGYVLFTSRADNLVQGDTNYANDVFIHVLR